MTDRGGFSTVVEVAIAKGFFDTRITRRIALLATTALRIIGGLLFIASAISKITAHQAELDLFVMSGLPNSSTLVYFVGALEAGFGLLLVLGLLTRLAALAMAANMIVAILTAGIHVGGPIHLGLAPTLLVAMLYLLWAGPGLAAIDRRWARREVLDGSHSLGNI